MKVQVKAKRKTRCYQIIRTAHLLNQVAGRNGRDLMSSCKIAGYFTKRKINFIILRNNEI